MFISIRNWNYMNLKIVLFANIIASAVDLLRFLKFNCKRLCDIILPRQLYFEIELLDGRQHHGLYRSFRDIAR